MCAGSILGHGGRRQSLMTGVAVGVDVFACLVTLLAESSATSEVEALFMTAGQDQSYLARDLILIFGF